MSIGFDEEDIESLEEQYLYGRNSQDEETHDLDGMIIEEDADGFDDIDEELDGDNAVDALASMDEATRQATISYDTNMEWVRDVMKRYRSSDLEIRQDAVAEIVERYKPYIHHCIHRRYQTYSAARNKDIYEVLFQSAVLGLMKGLQTFDENRGYKISTYCYRFMVGAMSSEYANEVRGITPHFNIRINKIDKAIRHFETIGKRYTERDIATYTGLTIEAVCKAMRVKTGSSNMVYYDGDDCEMEFPSRELTPEEAVVQNEQNHILYAALDQLRAKSEEQYLVLYYRFLAPKQKSISQIARELNCSQEDVKSFQIEALHYLRKNKSLATLRPDHNAKSTYMAEKVMAASVPTDYAEEMVNSLLSDLPAGEKRMYRPAI